MMGKIIVFGNSLNELGIIRSLGEMGLRVVLMLEPCRMNECYVRFSKYIEKVHVLGRIEEAFDILLQEYRNETIKSVILTGSDHVMAFLDSRYDELKRDFVLFNARGEGGRISFFMDKARTFPIAAECGLHTIRTWCVGDGASLPEGLVFPCIIKGGNSTRSTKADIAVCADMRDVERNLHRGVDYLIQEYVRKEFELCIVGFAWNHGKDVFVPAAVRKLRETITRQSDYIRLDDITKYEKLDVSAIKAFVQKIGYEGIFSVEFMFDGSKFRFLEINLRNDGTGYLYAKAGVNYPYLWLLYCTEGDAAVTAAVQAIRPKLPCSLMSEGDVYNLVEGKVPVLQWLRECFGADAHFILNCRDMKPFLFSTYIHFRQLCKKICRKVREIRR